MQVTITGVSIEVAKPGPKGYSKAVVSYTHNGESRTQSVMSFANPAVFKQVAEWELQLPNGPVDVTLTRNSTGYNEWSAVKEGTFSEKVPSGPSQGASAPSIRPANASNFPTNEERAKTQVYIVKQSSLGHAINYLNNKYKEGDPAYNVDNVLEIAQVFVDFVMGIDKDGA